MKSDNYLISKYFILVLSVLSLVGCGPSEEDLQDELNEEMADVENCLQEHLTRLNEINEGLKATHLSLANNEFENFTISTTQAISLQPTGNHFHICLTNIM